MPKGIFIPEERGRVMLPILRVMKPGQKQRRMYMRLALIIKDEVLITAVAKDSVRNGFSMVEGMLDFGAEESVAPPRIFPRPTVLSAMSKAGGRYRVAGCQRVPNISHQAVRFRTKEDLAKCVQCQTAEIERSLVSVSQPAAAGNRVIFTHEGGEIINKKTGKFKALHEHGGIYVPRMWIPFNPPGFLGHGR